MGPSAPIGTHVCMDVCTLAERRAIQPPPHRPRPPHTATGMTDSVLPAGCDPVGDRGGQMMKRVGGGGDAAAASPRRRRAGRRRAAV